MEFIGIIFFLLSLGVAQVLNSKFARYSRTRLQANLSGAEAANRMLQESSVEHVKITCTPGHLTDHYNPTNRTVNLRMTSTTDAMRPPWQ